jgi:hypothetical protein
MVVNVEFLEETKSPQFSTGKQLNPSEYPYLHAQGQNGFDGA